MVKILISLAHNRQDINIQVIKNIFDLFLSTKNVYPETELRIYDLWDVAGMRNLASKDALKDNFDYIYFLDSDMLYPHDSIVRLIQAHKQVIGGFYVKRLPPIVSTQYKTFDERGYGLLDPIEPNQGIIEIAATGFGGVLVKTEVFKRLNYPYFEMIHMPNGEVFGEDTYFCSRMKEQDIAVYSDSNLIYGHQTNSFIYPDRMDIL